MEVCTMRIDPSKLTADSVVVAGGQALYLQGSPAWCGGYSTWGYVRYDGHGTHGGRMSFRDGSLVTVVCRTVDGRVVTGS